MRMAIVTQIGNNTLSCFYHILTLQKAKSHRPIRLSPNGTTICEGIYILEFSNLQIFPLCHTIPFMVYRLYRVKKLNITVRLAASLNINHKREEHLQPPYL